ncbi:DUF4291 family protein [Streptomyces sp. JW3]|uniref:DUF4291 family protein n=1 Tax=Streptomyces sp. JW3 TaxID=3456955 RepID=UPI003FA424A2
MWSGCETGGPARPFPAGRAAVCPGCRLNGTVRVVENRWPGNTGQADAVRHGTTAARDPCHLRSIHDHIYQAYPPGLGQPAAEEGRFPAGWKRDRMTWLIMSRSQTSTGGCQGARTYTATVQGRRPSPGKRSG